MCQSPKFRQTSLLYLVRLTILIFTLIHLTSTQRHSTFSYYNKGQVRYWELQRMKAACYPLDSCREGKREDDSLLKYNCHCDSFCVRYNTCCVDSPFRRLRHTDNRHHSCLPIYKDIFHSYVFMVDRCKPDWNGDDYIRQLCIGDAEELSDPMVLIPVTNSKSQITYKNYFCSVCNNEMNLQHNTFWQVELTTHEGAFTTTDASNLKHDPKYNGWVLTNGSQVVRSDISVSLYIPDEVAPYVKHCKRDVTSECAADWPDDVIKRKCASYTAIVAVADAKMDFRLRRFRNVHCAICNHNLDYDLRCTLIDSVLTAGPPSRKPLSFALLLDINRSDGDRVGEVRRCNENAVYDKFFNKCRVLKCVVPGMVIKDGECVRA